MEEEQLREDASAGVMIKFIIVIYVIVIYLIENEPLR